MAKQGRRSTRSGEKRGRPEADAGNDGYEVAPRRLPSVSGGGGAAGQASTLPTVREVVRSRTATGPGRTPTLGDGAVTWPPDLALRPMCRTLRPASRLDP